MKIFVEVQLYDFKQQKIICLWSQQNIWIKKIFSENHARQIIELILRIKIWSHLRDQYKVIFILSWYKMLNDFDPIYVQNRQKGHNSGINLLSFKKTLIHKIFIKHWIPLHTIFCYQFLCDHATLPNWTFWHTQQ